MGPKKKTTVPVEEKAPLEHTSPVLTSSDQGQQVTIDRNAGKRTLEVTLTHNVPDFRFNGVWSGRDMLIVKRHLNKAYFQYTRAMRREGLATLTPQEETTNV